MHICLAVVRHNLYLLKRKEYAAEYWALKLVLAHDLIFLHIEVKIISVYEHKLISCISSLNPAPFGMPPFCIAFAIKKNQIEYFERGQSKREKEGRRGGGGGELQGWGLGQPIAVLCCSSNL